MARFDPGRVCRRSAPLALLAALAAGGCTELDNALASIPVFSFLRNAPSFDPYEAPRPAPAGAVPFATPGSIPVPGLAPTQASLAAFGDTVANPVPATTEALAAGQALYERYCAVCHGPAGQGNGPVVGPAKFPPVVPNLTIPPATQRTDGYIYGIIRVGRGLMPAYGDKVPGQGGWYIVNYVRYLQQQAGAGGVAPPGAAPPAGAGAADTAGADPQGSL